jgi:hypothetical protein
MNKDGMMTLRQGLGILGILLPVVDIFFGLFGFRVFGFPVRFPSISATHYYNSYLLFEGLVFATGCFLIAYRGYDIKDHVLSILAGCGAIVLTLFPCNPPPDSMSSVPWNFLMLPWGITQYFHDAGALVFFGMLFWIIEFQFTKHGEVVTWKKSVRNKIYRVCGWVMLAGLVFGFFPGGWWQDWVIGRTYIGEWVSLWAFGIAWVTKGQMFFKDEC